MNEETKEVIEDDDIIMPDDLEDTPIDEESDNEVEPKEEQTSESEEKPQEPEDEDKKFLDYLNKKGLIKYNGSNVEVKSFDDLVQNYQKGMNYEKHQARNEHEDDVVLSYISEMASKMGLTKEQYIEQVKAYQKQKEEEAKEAEVQKMMAKGLDEETARRVARTEAALNELEREKAELQKQKEESERKAREDKEYEDFIKEYPDVDASKIPDEVFKDAKTIGLLSAYERYENKLLKEKIKTLEQNVKNASNSIVVPTSEGSPTEQESKDAFLEGFDSED